MQLRRDPNPHALTGDWCLYVDGENLTLRTQDLLPALKSQRPGQPPETSEGRYRRDVFVWINRPGIFPFWHSAMYTGSARRAKYYTSMIGDMDGIDLVYAELRDLHFEPTIIKKEKAKGSKGVDISLTCDALTDAHNGFFGTCVLVTNDGDYVPLIRELKRLGKYVVVCGVRGTGFSDSLEKEADFVFDLTSLLQQSFPKALHRELIDRMAHFTRDT